MASVPKVVKQLLQEQIAHDIQINGSQTLGGGCINHAVKLSTSQGDYFVKWNDNCPRDLFLREAESLEELAKPDTAFVVPRVIAATELTDDDPGAIITEYLPPATNRSKGEDEQLGTGLAQLHRFRGDKFGFYHNNYCGATLQNNDWNDNWINFFGQQRIQYLLDLIRDSRSLGGDEQKTYQRLIDKLPELIGHEPEPALNHGDLWSGNYMYTQKGPALIDPASYYADREFDLSIVNMFGGFSDTFWNAYQEAYPLPPEWRSRNDLYMIYHYLNHYYLFGGSYGQQAMGIAKRFI